MSRVIVLDTLAQEGLDMLDAAPGIQYEVRTGLIFKDRMAAGTSKPNLASRSNIRKR